MDTGHRKRRALILTLATVFALSGCAKRPAEQEISTELSNEFHLVGQQPARNLERVDVIRRGTRRKSLILVAPAVVRASLNGISGRAILTCIAAPVFNVGDGIQMNVFLRRGGSRIEVGAGYFDPGRIAEDREWKQIRFPLEIQQSDQLEIEAAGGPQGDLIADWLAIGSVLLTTRADAPALRLSLQGAQ